MLNSTVLCQDKQGQKIPSATEPTPPDFFVDVFFWRMASADECVNDNFPDNSWKLFVKKGKTYLIYWHPLFAFALEPPLILYAKLCFLSQDGQSSIRWK